MALRGKPIEPGLAIVFRCPVLGGDEAVFEKPLQCRIERAVPHLQHFPRAVLNRAGNGMPVDGTKGYRLQNQKVQSALEKPGLVVGVSSRHSTGVYGRSGRMSRGGCKILMANPTHFGSTSWKEPRNFMDLSSQFGLTCKQRPI